MINLRDVEATVGATRASPEIRPQRKNVRLRRHIYVQYGYYFVTACTDRRRQVLSTVQQGESYLSSLGEMVSDTLRSIPEHHPGWEVDCFVVMPNHCHLVLFNLKHREVALSESGPERRSLSSVIGSAKSAITRQARQRRMWGPEPLLQRGFYDHVVRSEDSLHYIREYILYNPLEWDQDYLNPLRRIEDPFEQWIRHEDTLPYSLWFSGDARVAPTGGGR